LEDGRAFLVEEHQLTRVHEGEAGVESGW